MRYIKKQTKKNKDFVYDYIPTLEELAYLNARNIQMDVVSIGRKNQGADGYLLSEYHYLKK